MRFIGKFIAAIVFGLVAAAAAMPLGAALFQPSNGGAENSAGAVFVLLVLLAVILVVLFATTVRRAFGRGFLLSGAAFLVLPLSTLFLSGRIVFDMTNEAAGSGASELDQAATAFGATLGAGMLTGVASFLGLILGGIFVIFGLVLVLGGRREVVVVQQ